MAKRGGLYALTAAAAALLVVYALFDPSSHLFPRCPFLALTGLECPGCGSQRAIHALLHLRIARAMSFNPLVLPGIVYIALLWVSTRFPALHRALTSQAASLAVLAVVTGWWILRNLI